ncbi:deubiquitinating enzyme [Oleoguttula sp. CCFEE 5521]
MATVPIKVKHQGKTYDVEVDTASNGEELMLQLYSLTNVEPENQKIMAGKMIKSDTLLSAVKWKTGQTITLIGQPSANVVTEAPEKPKFIEDMSEAEMARRADAMPAGLTNTGNTCYANATLQTLRIIPELQDQLKTYTPAASSAGPSNAASSLFSAEQLASVGLGGLGAGNDLTTALRDLYTMMKDTQGAVQPIMFLTALRQKFPQFAEKAKHGHGFAQQDAEEVWSQLIETLNQSLKLDGQDESNKGFGGFVDKYLGGRFESTTKCDEAPEEGEVHGSDSFKDLKCNIQSDTNHLREGIAIGLNEKIEKRSESLGRDAIYTKTSRIARLPKYLPVHLMRFFWRKDSKQKAKILRKVTFQHEIDLLEFCTDELRKKLVPVRDKVREVRKEIEDVERQKKRQKRRRQEMEDDPNAEGKVKKDEPMQKRKEKEAAREAEKEKASAAATSSVATTDGTADVAMGGTEEVFKTDAEIEQERAVAIKAAKQDLLDSVDPAMKADSTANQTGLYELRGVITHQGSSADSGHYTAYVKKTAPEGKEEDGSWWWFNDDKVQEVDADKIEQLAGGGETHSALILLYRAVELPTIEEAKVA